MRLGIRMWLLEMGPREQSGHWAAMRENNPPVSASHPALQCGVGYEQEAIQPSCLEAGPSRVAAPLRRASRALDSCWQRCALCTRCART